MRRVHSLICSALRQLWLHCGEAVTVNRVVVRREIHAPIRKRQSAAMRKSRGVVARRKQLFTGGSVKRVHRRMRCHLFPFRSSVRTPILLGEAW